MDTTKYCLYLDESGNFETDDQKNIPGWTPSFVGGILCPSETISVRKLNELIPDHTHAMESYKKEEFFSIIEELLHLGGRIILFENNEHVHIIDGDTTYLNIITEGLTKLLRDLHNNSPHTRIVIDIVIATRQNSRERAMGNHIRIIADEYLRRFEEKMYVSLGRNKIEHVDFTISFANAIKDKGLMSADIICNTWFTRFAPKKFNDEDRKQIDQMYANCIHYEIYEDPGSSYLRRLISENRIGEAIAQLCMHFELDRNLEVINALLLQRIKTESTKECEFYFSYISLKLGQFIQHREFDIGIRFAKQYEALILSPLHEVKKFCSVVEYWMFDTDFYILTMYDHLGDTNQCEEYSKRCNARIHAVNCSLEHINYYFSFRIRELNRMINRFDFESVLSQSEPLIKALLDSKELLDVIDLRSSGDQARRSPLLGKIYGVRLAAYINLLPRHPELLKDAVNTSDLAIAEFTNPMDIQRQYQYRCLLHTVAKDTDNALSYLAKSINIENNDQVFPCLVKSIFPDHSKTDIFSLLHYTNLMVLLKQKHDSRAEMMKAALDTSRRFLRECQSAEENDYPWNIILWNVSRYLRMNGNKTAADNWYEQALSRTTKHRSEITMYSFALCMCADRLHWYETHEPQHTKAAQRSYDSTYRKFQEMSMPDTIRNWYSGDYWNFVPLR